VGIFNSIIMKKNIAILGSTGSIGKSTLKIIKNNNQFNVRLLVTNKNFIEINKQIKIFKPSVVIIINKNIYLKIKKKYQSKNCIILNNVSDSQKHIKKIDITVSAIPGIAGLEPTILFTKISKKILIANKEAIICGWHLIKKNAIKYSTELIPIDSEHFSISVLLKNIKKDQVEKIYLTASGGPFLKLNINKFKKISPNDAIKHPKWSMGKKISVDSATLMNKVLEITEALKLFPFKLNQYEIIVHPESLIHAIIKLKNGTSFFFHHLPDMKIPIGNALIEDFNYRNFSNYKTKNHNKMYNLNFMQVDKKKFPSVNLIPEMNSRKSSSIIINAANEIFVDEFLKKIINFNDIVSNLKLVLKDKSYIKTSNLPADSVKNIYTIDSWARATALKIINKKNKKC
jgi:1-deoxy-D-xylulose-5-phosphate reductoisomerase